MPKTTTRSWREGQAWKAELLERRTGHGLAWWNDQVAEQDPKEPDELRTWLREQGVTGYPLELVVMERFGYPEFLKASPEELIEGQYADREALRPIFDRLLEKSQALGEVAVQARKGYVALLTPRRTFASIEPTTKTRLDLGLRLPDEKPGGRLEKARSLGQSQMTHKVELSRPDDVDREVLGWLKQAYEAST